MNTLLWLSLAAVVWIVLLALALVLVTANGRGPTRPREGP